VRNNGAKLLPGSHPRGRPATVAIDLRDMRIRVLAKEDGGEWEEVAAFPRDAFPGAPATVRIGKIGANWAPQDFARKGTTAPCRVEWVAIH
jgi:hypothetical protein